MAPRNNPLRAGSFATRLLGLIQAAEKPIARGDLIAALSSGDRQFFKREIDRLQRKQLVRETCAGFVSMGAGATVSPPAAVPAYRVLDAGQRQSAAAIIRRAHAYRRAGAPSLAADLLERAAARATLPHLREDLGALASLFAAHRETFPEMAAPRAAA